MPAEKKISAGQLMLMLFLARIMHTMIFRASHSASGAAMMLGLLCSTAVEAVLAIPAVWYFSAGGSDPIREISGKYSTAVRLLYSGYFAIIAGGTVALFAEFLSSEFSNVAPPAAAIILLIFAAAYCACLGIEGLARAATVVFWMFVLLFGLMAAVNEGGFDWLNLRPFTAEDAGSFSDYFFESLSSGWWLPMFCVLAVHLKKGAVGAAYGYLVLKLLILETLLLLVTIVLWRYVDVIGYPIFALGAYAKTDFIERFDAINMLVWAINCTLVVGIYLFICSGSLKKPKPAAILFAIAAAVFGIFEYKNGLRFDQPWFLGFKLAGVALLGVILPSAAAVKLLIKRSSER